MTKLLNQALEAVRALPAAKQDEIARALICLAENELNDDRDEEEVDPADLPGLLEGLADADAGRFASEEEIEALFRRFDR